jgi:hypothetical protein
MKIRTRGDSVRVRLKRGEVDQLAAGCSVVDQTHFPNAVLTCRLDVTDFDDISASFSDGTIALTVPRSRVLVWANTDEVSLYAEQNLSETGFLSVLIEKDFRCLEPGHHRGCEDDEDTFPHPSAESMNAAQLSTRT